MVNVKSNMKTVIVANETKLFNHLSIEGHPNIGSCPHSY